MHDWLNGATVPAFNDFSVIQLDSKQPTLFQ